MFVQEFFEFEDSYCWLCLKKVVVEIMKVE